MYLLVHLDTTTKINEHIFASNSDFHFKQRASDPNLQTKYYMLMNLTMKRMKLILILIRLGFLVSFLLKSLYVIIC